jgi:hypothetical protein
MNGGTNPKQQKGFAVQRDDRTELVKARSDPQFDKPRLATDAGVPACRSFAAKAKVTTVLPL